MKRLGLIICSFYAVTGPALAAVSMEEARQLGNTLTLFGAEKAGNKEGTIPEYTGEQIKQPASYDSKKPSIRPEPWNDKILLSITAQNYTKYTDKLTDGQKAMFKLYPGFRMDIYPTRRTAVYPKYVLDNTLKNATSCKGDSPKEERLTGCYGGVPFPIPKTGMQMMWNHLTQYQQHAWSGDMTSYVVSANGDLLLQALSSNAQASELYDPSRTAPATDKTVYYQARLDTSAPARTTGSKLMFIQTMDQQNRAWQYIPGQRRVKLAPDLAYDTPNPQSGGVYTMDDSTTFFGSIDRYDWQIIGKRENYILYNTYKANNPEICPAKVLLKTGFLNPDCLRYELHRVWVIEAKLKPGFRHIYHRRVFYYDEDMPGVGTADNFDYAGKLYRISNVYPYAFYEGIGFAAQNYSVQDVATGSYATTGFAAQEPWHPTKPMPPTFFSAESMAGEGIR